MGQRQDLHQMMVSIPGVAKVYFQPPPGLKMEYPAIVYRRDAADTIFADNQPYNHVRRYQVTVIDRDPDSTIPLAVAALRRCVFDRFYVADQLNHDVFNLFF